MWGPSVQLPQGSSQLTIIPGAASCVFCPDFQNPAEFLLTRRLALLVTCRVIMHWEKGHKNSRMGRTSQKHHLTWQYEIMGRHQCTRPCINLVDVFHQSRSHESGQFSRSKRDATSDLENPDMGRPIHSLRSFENLPCCHVLGLAMVTIGFAFSCKATRSRASKEPPSFVAPTALLRRLHHG